MQIIPPKEISIHEPNILCERFHEISNRMKRFCYPYDKKDIPGNGIYVVFEEGEMAHGGARIVRIGTHSGPNNLRARLAEHFYKENKDRSIFRKNIGRALLQRRKDPFLAQWDIDLTPRKNRERYAGKIDFKKQAEIEAEVTRIIRSHFSFCVYPDDNKQHRLELEKRMIATVNQCTDCRQSAGWLGKHSPREKIRQSGLWVMRGLKHTPLQSKDLDRLESTLEKGEGIYKGEMR